MSSSSPTRDLVGLDLLDDEHVQTFKQALMNILMTDVAELTYAQILDGLPTEQSLHDSFVFMEGHPVYQLEHKEICEGYLEKAREFRSQFDPSSLLFDQALLLAFQDTSRGSPKFNLRLIEFVVVACHQIAAYLFELDDGAHKHKLHADWLAKETLETVNGIHRGGYALPLAAFFHYAYQRSEQYPRGLADVAGYWAEGKIFGGVVVFDRGETEKECKEVWIHGARIRGPRTLYPPTKSQFDALISFLLSSPDEKIDCPLPIHGTPLNRPRWDSYEAFTRFHIFRDRYERKPPSIRPPRGCTYGSGRDWPEVNDEMFLLEQSRARHYGHPVDEEAVAAARERMEQVTPSSPYWRRS